MKGKTTLADHNGNIKQNEGDYVIAIQGNKSGDSIMVNIDWSFDENVSPTEIKSMFGGLLGNLEDMWGEKMVTEIIAHWADETGKLVKFPGKKVAYLKSNGEEFKEGI